jgi:hypothetical protein
MRRTDGRTDAQTSTIVVDLAIFALVGILMWWFLDWYVAPNNATDPSTAKKDLVQAWGFIMAGAAGGVGIYFTWRNLRTTQENLRVTEQGQITERFTRAIDQLGATDDEGNKRLEIRLGAIYALERIARDSEEDHWPVMEILTAYVREHAPWPPRETVESKEYGKGLSYSETTTHNAFDMPDIQAIVTVIRRRSRYFGAGEDERLDLSHTDLRKTNLDGAHLEGSILVGAHLEGAYLGGADFEGAHLQLTYLQGADLEESKNLTQEQIDKANGDETTKLPKDHLHRPAHWSKGDEEHSEES